MIDSHSLIIQQNGKTDLCALNMGSVIGYYGAIEYPPSSDNLIAATEEHLSPHDAVYKHHPKSENRHLYLPKDQIAHLMLGYAIAGRRDLVKKYYKSVKKNSFRHADGSFISFAEIGNLLRIFCGDWAYFLLCLFDLRFLYLGNEPEKYAMPLWYAKNFHSTPIIWLVVSFFNKGKANFQLEQKTGHAFEGSREALFCNKWFVDHI
jgi:hypothetical protein